MEDKKRYIVSSLLYGFVSAGFISLLLYIFMSTVPVEYLADLITYFANNPGLICSAIFAELFLIISILEIFRVVFESGKKSSVKKVEKAPAKKAPAKKTAKKAAKK